MFNASISNVKEIINVKIQMRINVKGYNSKPFWDLSFGLDLKFELCHLAFTV